MKILLMLWLVGLFMSTACEGRENPSVVVEPEVERTKPEVDQAKAKRLAAQRYRELFEDKYLFDSGGGTYLSMPAVKESDFNRVESAGASWLVMIHQPAGLEVEARVAKDGSYTELVRARWASE